MANAIVKLPTGYFPDPDRGRPLFNAKIYIGEEDLNPRIEANQKTVTGRQEDGTEVTLEQPIRTNSGGVPIDGSDNVVVLLVDGAYSMAVDDRQDNQKYYFDNVYEGAPVTFDVFGETLAEYTNLDFINIANTKAGLLPNGETIDLEIGYRVSTRGYTTENDGGGAEYVVVAGGTGTDDGGSYIDLDNGNQLEAIFGEEVRLEQFGVILDNSTDNINQIRNALAFQQSDYRKITGGSGFCLFSDRIELFSNTWIEGRGMSSSRSSTGSINDNGLVFKYTGSSTSDALFYCNTDGSQGFVHFLQLRRIRIDCNESENGMELQGLNEYCVIEDVDIGNYTHGGVICIEHDSVAGRFVNNQCQFKRMKLVPYSTSAKTSYGMFFRELHRGLCENITIDAQASNSTNTINYGFQIGRGCFESTFQSCYAENCDNGFILGESGEDNATCKVNTLLDCGTECPQYEPDDTTFDGITGTISIGVYDGVKWYNIINYECSKAFGSSPFSYDYLIVDETQSKNIPRSNVSSTSDRVVFINATENLYGRSIFRSDAFTDDQSARGSSVEIVLVDGDTYPDIEGDYTLSTLNTSATTITGFDGGFEGQEIEIRFRDALTTLETDNDVGGTNILLNGNTDLTTPAINSMIRLRLRGTSWIETSRMVRTS